MKNVWLLAGLLFIGRASVTAQPEIKASDREQIKQLFSKDTAYSRFRTKLKQVIKKANGQFTNVAEVKKLFTENKNTLAKLVRANKIISAVQNDHGPFTIITPTVLGELPQNKGLYERRHTYAPSYDANFTGGFHIPKQLEEVNSNPAMGKIGYKYDNDEETGMSLGTSTITFSQGMQGQNDPLLLTARVEFQYSFMVTGWDSKFADFGMGLYLRCWNFRNDAFTALPPIFESSPQMMENARRVKDLVPRVSVEDNIESFSKIVQGSFIIDGYIDPSAETSFRFEAAYDPYSKGGLFGSYHYGEFKLKRIIVSYFKGGN